MNTIEKRTAMNIENMSRRTVLRASATLAVAGVAGKHAVGKEEKSVTKGRLKQSVCKWCYKLPLEELAKASKKLGLVGIDLVDPKDFGILKEHGLLCTMTTSHGITNGLNDPKHHKACLDAINKGIEANAKEGFKNIICFSGNRRGMDARTGIKNCVAALREIVPVAEKAGVVINMELLNSRVNHPDYMCDTSEWGIELVKQVGSDNFKLLYDIYHMQIMEGDIIRSIQNNHKYFGHYHTAGNPGRNELDQNQELNYPAICRAIVETGFDGYLAQEFIPKRDQLTSLAEAVELCDV